LDDKLALVWRLRVSHWTFTANFHKESQTLNLILEARPGAEVPIKNLNAQPLQFADPETVENLKKRGEAFWKCRSCRYVESKTEESFRSSSSHVSEVSVLSLADLPLT
jgi:hypothetical protein